MIKAILFILLSIPTLAKTYVIEIADFACKYCKEAEHYTHKLKLETEKYGDEFIFAPIVFSKGSKVEELFYYSLRNNIQFERFARNAMFTLKQEQRIEMSTMQELLDWLMIYYADESEFIQSIIKEYEKSTKDFSNIKAYLKALSLVNKQNIKQTPTFLIIDETAQIVTVRKPEKMPVPEYVDHVLDMYKRISKNEN